MSDAETPAGPHDEWDFYPCRVDDHPASILINLRFLYEDPLETNTYVHHAFLLMKETGPHGMGTQAEMERLSPIEDAIFDRAEQAGAQPVGRLRGQGVWQLSVYGPEELPIADWLSELMNDETQVKTQALEDPEFEYLNEFLLPDPERHQWIMDRRVCDQLRQQGDDAAKLRPVDHFISYEGSVPAGLVDAIKERGFEVTDTGEGLECVKAHDVQLDTVHEIVMDLSELAEEHDAAYDGWGAPVIKPNELTN
jgi:regulator of RNase E activity RraB